MAAYVTDGVPPELAARVVNFDTLQATLDVAEVAAIVLSEPEAHRGQSYTLAGPRPVPWSVVTDALKTGELEDQNSGRVSSSHSISRGRRALMPLTL